MAGSEIAQIRETIAREYMAAKWGLTGFAQGSAKHEFISARMERIEEGRKALEVYVGGESIALVAETLDTVPEKPTRDHMQEMLRHEFGNTDDTEYLLNDLKDAWETFDLLIACFGMEGAQKMINASPS
jgi:hypothetical protein